MLGLYLHIPFCGAICHYCNFNRGLLDADLKARYVDALVTEIRRAADGAAADTIYFGGGTPSLLAPDEVGRLITACRESFAMTPDAEVTLELNPETATAEYLAAIRAAGTTRLSIGVQSFDDVELKRLGRVHSADRARDAVRLARGAGFDDLSLDLMMWLPEQTVARWLANVEALIETGPDHASLYLLEIYPNAPLRDEMARGGWSQAPDDDAADMYLRGLDLLDRAGYEHYEISNVARPGHQSRHNVKYWADGEWLAFGCGAHATRAGRRWHNVPGTADYVSRITTGQSVVASVRTLTPQTHAEEALFTGIRLSKGVSLVDIAQRYGVDAWDAYGTALTPFIEAGVVEYTPPVLRLTRQGMLLANEVCAVFV
ncbi:MAG: radical SAM family heme chaperone HemW [Vicinamibacteraceae bacterium]